MFLEIYYCSPLNYDCMLYFNCLDGTDCIHDPLMYPSITEIMLKQPAAPAGQSFSPFNHQQKGTCLGHMWRSVKTITISLFPRTTGSHVHGINNNLLSQLPIAPHSSRSFPADGNRAWPDMPLQ